MHDIKAIRSEPNRFIEGWRRRGVPDSEGVVSHLFVLDTNLRRAIAAKQAAETARNAASKQIGAAKAKGDDTEFERLRLHVADLKNTMDVQGAIELELRGELEERLARLPNLAAEDVPLGADETANAEVRRHGEAPRMNFEPKDHVAIGEGLGMMDFERAAAISGARFVMLTGKLARLERALAQFMLDVHTEEFGYTEVAPPLLVRDDAMYGTGQLPKFAEDLFSVAGGFWLIPTAEVPLTNTVREQIVPEETLPRRLTAATPCFRSEAGSAGRDTRGMIRVHQFEKVELVSITTPEQSDEEHERMTGCAEAILQRLGLPYRVMLLCSGDMGFGARKTYDLEVWLPSQGKYREISSCSNCGDFQARRMNARYRAEGAKETAFLHTLNGSGVAVGRALVAVLENYQQEDGSVLIPEALRPYMRGAERIEVPA